MIWGTYESKEHKIAKEKLNKALTGRNAEMGLYNGEPTYCTVNAYGDCPYCDQCGVCHIENPMEDCEDFAVFFQGDWNYWLSLDVPDEGEDADNFWWDW